MRHVPYYKMRWGLGPVPFWALGPGITAFFELGPGPRPLFEHGIWDLGYLEGGLITRG
jgi:hypothetical protein